MNPPPADGAGPRVRSDGADDGRPAPAGAVGRRPPTGGAGAGEQPPAGGARHRLRADDTDAAVPPPAGGARHRLRTDGADAAVPPPAGGARHRLRTDGADAAVPPPAGGARHRLRTDGADAAVPPPAGGVGHRLRAKGARDPKPPLTLRSQLVLGSVGVVALTFTVLALLLAAFFGHYFATGRISALTLRTRTAARMLRARPAVADGKVAALVRDTGGHLWVIDPQGKVRRGFGPAWFGSYADWIASSELADVLAGHGLTRASSRQQGKHTTLMAVVAIPARNLWGMPRTKTAALVWAAPIGGGPLLEAVSVRIVAVAALGLLLAALLFAWLGGWVAAPIRRLQHIASRIAGGGFAAGKEAAALRPRGPAEVDGLASSVAEMARRLSDLDRERREFLADVSHELRSPLAALRGALDGLRTPAGNRERALNLAIGETDRLGRLVDDLLVLARSQAARPLELHRQAVDLREAVLRVALSLEPLAHARSVEFRFDSADGPIRVSADPDRLSQVLWNLLDNAVRHTPSGGEAAVAVAAVDGMARLVIANPGPPIPATTLARLFLRFERGGALSDGGTGLGLAIARTLTEAHGGQIAAESPPAGGLAVTVHWPWA